MTDPRNIAHDKKVQQEKKHKGEDIAEGTTHTPQPGKKPHMQEHKRDDAADHEVKPDDETSDDKAGGGTAGV